MTTIAATNAPTAPKFRGQLPLRTAGAFSVWEWFKDGSAIIRNFDDEFLAVQCAVALGTQVETNELEDSLLLHPR